MAMILVELLVLYLIPKNWQLVMWVCFLMDNLTLNVQIIGSQVTGTAGPKLYQSSRQSSGSLRFYGLSLENGLHNVSLSSAETVFGDQGSQKWVSLEGVFLISIFRILQLKDFDISTRAGGEGKAITNKFNASVSENYLEIHLLWAGKETCCIPDRDFIPTVGIRRKKKKSGLIVGIAVALGSLGLILIFLIPHLRIKRENDDAEGRRERHLDWPTWFKICLGTARGLAYLHEDSRPKIILRDVKTSNILLDAKLCQKISDFGLAKLYDDTKTHMSTRVARTSGYLALVYAMRGPLTTMADVFSFGFVALEIMSGRANSDTSLDREKIYLLEWAWSLHESNQSLGLIDPNLAEFNEIKAL